MRILIFILLALSSMEIRAQANFIENRIDCVFNIEARFSNYEYYRKLQERQNNPIEVQKIYMDSIMHSGRGNLGTAFLVKKENRYYLITAKHVVIDTTYYLVDSLALVPKIILVESDSLNQYYSLGFEETPGNYQETSLDFLGPRRYEDMPYVISAKEDIAIIDLSYRKNYSFLKTLFYRKIKPIDIKDIDTKCDHIKGKKICIIGFPKESFYDSSSLSFTETYDNSKIRSYPVVTYGYVRNDYPKQTYFEGAIFNYQGFSGGPVFSEDNKLIGITIANAITRKKNKNRTYREIRPTFLKASILQDLFIELKIKVAKLEN